MNSFPQQSPNWWATYLKAVLFILPAILLWGVSVVFVVPKVEQIFATAGGHPLPGFLPLMLSLSHQGTLIVGLAAVVLALLEWRSQRWPRYRNFAVGLGVFVLNSAILGSFFLLIIGVAAVAPALMKGVQ